MPKRAKKATPPDGLSSAAAQLRSAALAFPEAVEEHPWGENAFKVKKKVFLFLFHGVYKGQTLLNATMKLPESHATAVLLPFAKPTGYGLGKSGWITSSFLPGDAVPLDILSEWLAESYRAIAPAKLAATLADEPAPRAKKKSPQRARKKSK